MQYDEGLRMAMVLKFLEYISYIKIKRSGPSSGSLHEKKCILLSVLYKPRSRHLLMSMNLLYLILEAKHFLRRRTMIWIEEKKNTAIALFILFLISYLDKQSFAFYTMKIVQL